MTPFEGSKGSSEIRVDLTILDMTSFEESRGSSEKQSHGLYIY
jgi:hypothetical protein